MQTRRLEEFNKNRAEVLKAHMMRDKTYLATRSKRRLRIVLGAFQVVLGTVAVLALLKSLMLATNTPGDYARIVAPALQGLDASHPFAQVLLPDSVTQSVADALRPFLSDATNADLAFGPPAPPVISNPSIAPDT